MEKCVHCSKKIDKESRFCKHCGNSVNMNNTAEKAPKVFFCTGCGAKIPDGGKYCLVCGTKRGQAPSEYVSSAVEKPGDKSRMDSFFMRLNASKGKEYITASIISYKAVMRRTALFLVMILIIGAGIVGAWALLPYIIPADVPSVGEGIAYIKGDNTLMLNFTDREPMVVSTGFKKANAVDESGLIKARADGKYIAYINGAGFENGGGLYILDMTKLNRPEIQPPEGTLLVDVPVTEYMFSAKGEHIVYVSADGGLYVYDYKNTWQLDDNVTGIIEAGDKQIVYTKKGILSAGFSMERFDIYLQSIDEDIDDKIQIAQNASELLDWTADYKSFIYAQPKNVGYAGNYTFDILYFDTVNYQAQTLVASSDVVLSASAKDASVVFARKSEFLLKYEDLINDPQEEEDSLLEEPTTESFGLPEGYEKTIMEGIEPQTPADGLDEVLDTYYQAGQDYLKALEAYEQKLLRDNMRAKAKKAVALANFENFYRYEIAIYKDNATRIIDENVVAVNKDITNAAFYDEIRYDETAGYLLYLRNGYRNIQRINLSAFSTDVPDIDIESYYLTKVPKQLCISTFSSESKVVYTGTGEKSIVDFEADLNLQGVYYVANRENKQAEGGTMYYSAITDGVPAEPISVDTSVWDLVESADNFNGSMLYWKNVEGNMGDIYSTSGGQNPVEIAADISVIPGFDVENSSKTLIYYRRYASTSNSFDKIKGEIYILDNQERFIVGDVYTHDYRNDTLVYLFRNKTGLGTGELYTYTVAGVAAVDSNVKEILPIS